MWTPEAVQKLVESIGTVIVTALFIFMVFRSSK